ncbi:MAG: serine hydrolase domain-containing protein [Christensenellales bacterium]
MDHYATLDSVLSQIVESWEIPGLALGIVSADRVLYARYFGVQRLDTGVPVGPGTIFCIASACKCFVATAVMQLAECCKLDIDGPLLRYLPHFALADERCPQITIRHLLCHMSGLPDMDEEAYDAFLAAPEYDEGALRRYVAGLAGSRLISAPGERFSYSNIGYNVLGDLIAHVSGQPFEDYMRDHLLLPAGMRGSTFHFPRSRIARLAFPHILTPALAVRPAYPYHRADAPASFLHTTLPDLLSWCRVSLNRGVSVKQTVTLSRRQRSKRIAPLIGAA